MPKTLVSDIIVPTEFAPYMIERTTTLSEIIASGIAERDPDFDKRASSGGKTVNMPFWKEITGSSEVLKGSASLAVDKITSGQDVAAINNRGKAWGVNDLAKWISGDDPAGHIASMVGGFWARDMQEILLKILDGLFNNTSGVLKDTHRLNVYTDVAAGSITDAMRLHGETFVDATQKLGDAKWKLSGVLMHSEVESLLLKRELIDFLPDSEGKMRIKVFQGRRVIVDDGCPKVNGTNSPAYTTYLFGNGAFAWGEGALDADEQVETNRDTLASDDLLAVRRRFILHPRGVKWVGSPVDDSPTNTELAVPASWQKVFSDKNVKIVAVRHNV
jgi:hypothetical protein